MDGVHWIASHAACSSAASAFAHVPAAVIGAVIAVLTAVGVYHAPYQPVNKAQSQPYSPPDVTGNNPWPS